MEKSILVGGVARSGKSTLVSRIRAAKPQLTYVCGDAFIGTFEKVYPELGICHIQEHSITCANLDNFLFSYLENLNEDENIPYVLDTFHMLPEQIARRDLQKKHHVVFLGYPGLTVEKKLSDIRAYDPKNSWTQDIDDVTLSEWIGRFISNSDKIRQQCKEFGIIFIDTGKTSHEAGLAQALKAVGI